jgi:hypothetical protein
VFYQQDEWAGVGDVIAYGSTRFLGKFSILSIFAGSGRILGSIFNLIFYQYFTFQSWPFAVFSILVHAINTILLYYVSLKISKNTILSWLAAIIFVCFYGPVQAITWFAANTTTLPSATFVLASILLLLTFLETNNKKYLIFSEISAITAYLFKESGVIIFVILPALYVTLSSKKISFIEVVKKFWPLGVYLLFCLVVVLRNYLNIPANTAAFVANTPYMKEKFLFNVLLYPVISVSQIFIPDIYLYKFATFFQSAMYPFINGNLMASSVRDNMTADVVSMYFSLIVIVVSVAMAFAVKKVGKVIRYALIFIGLSFLPYIILRRGGSYLDSRYFYLGSAGGALLLSALLIGIADMFKKYTRFYRYVLIIMGIALCFYLFINIRLIRRSVAQLASVSSERIQLLKQFTHLYPTLPNKPIVYISGDSNGYYGLTNVKIPLEQGPGYTLMVWYFPMGGVPREFFQNDFLWGIRDQGYREVNGKGFGYFWDKNDLLNLFKQNPKLSENQIVAFYYKSNDRLLLDITPEIRDYIRTNRGSSL